MKRGMNKRGQVFLLAAIIFSIAIYSVAIQYNSIIVYPNLEDFEDISENYQNEYPKVYNYAVYKGDNVAEKIDEFSADFVDEARKRDPNFGVFYAFQDVNGNVHIVNTLNDKVLTVKFKNDFNGSTTELKLLPSNTQSIGHICIGSLCGTASTNLDSSFYAKDYRGLPAKIEIVDQEGQSFGIYDLSDFTSLSYVQSNEPLKTADGDEVEQVKVSIKQY